MRTILAMAAKDLRLIARDRSGFFFVFFFPILYAVFFGFIMKSFSAGEGDLPKVRIAVVDEDNSDASRAFVEKLKTSSELDTQVEPSRDAALTLVRTGKRAAALTIKPGWGEATDRMFWGDPPTIELAADPSRQVEAGMLQGILMKLAAERFESLFSDPAAMRDNAQKTLAELSKSDDLPIGIKLALTTMMGSLQTLSDEIDAEQQSSDEETTADTGDGPRGFEPVRIETASVSADEDDGPNAFGISFPQAIAWGLISASAGFGISFVTERTRGTMTRLRTAPVRPWQILGGKALACFATTIGVATFLLIIARLPPFRVVPASYPMLALAVFSCAVCFVGVMMLLSVLGRTEASASGIGWAVLTVMAMIGGGMVPYFFLQRIPAMAMISNISPVKWSIVALEGAIWRGLTPAQMAVPCTILIAIGIAGFAIGSTLFQRLERH